MAAGSSCRTPSAAVPDLVGLDVDEAKAQVEGNDWNVGVDLVRRNGTGVDEMIAQSPRTGDRTSLPARN